MSQEEGEVKGPRLIEDRPRRLQVAAFLGIGSALTPFSQIKLQLGRPFCLSHEILPHTPSVQL